MVNESAPSDVKRAAKEAQKMLDDKKLRADLQKKFDNNLVNDLLDWYKERIKEDILGEWDDWYDEDDAEGTPVEEFWDMLSSDCFDTDGAGEFFLDDYEYNDEEVSNLLRELYKLWKSKK